MKPPKSLLRSLSRNKQLKLREGVYRHLKEREWLFSRVEIDTIFVIHESGNFGMGVRVEDIDWSDVCP